MATVTKCFNSAQPHEQITLRAAFYELKKISKEDNDKIQGYGADYAADLLDYGHITLGDVSYHLN